MYIYIYICVHAYISCMYIYVIYFFFHMRHACWMLSPNGKDSSRYVTNTFVHINSCTFLYICRVVSAGVRKELGGDGKGLLSPPAHSHDNPA